MARIRGFRIANSASVVTAPHVEPIRPDEVRSLEPELLGLCVHHRDERLAVAAADVIGERDSSVVRALNQRRFDEISHADALAGAEVHGRLTHCGRIRPDPHHRVPARMIERDDHCHQLRETCDRHTRPGSVLRKHFPGRGILDDERSRKNRRWRRCCRVRSGDEGERREEGGDPDPEDHEREG